MKTAKKIGLSGLMLTAAKDAESTLARQESMALEHGVPVGHPLRNEAEKQKMLLGDLSGLPPGHPLIQAMTAAKERYEQQQAQKTEEQSKTTKIKHAQKIHQDRARREARRIEEEQNEAALQAAKKVDIEIKTMLENVRRLYKTMADSEEILNIDPISRMKVGRLKRLLFAAERGLSDCRIVKVRA